MSKLTKHLDRFDQIIDLKPLVNEVSAIDKTDSKSSGHPRKNPLRMIKTTFLERINEQLQAKGLLVKNGTIVDALIFPLSGHPLSRTKHEALIEQLSSHINIVATSSRKGRTFRFGFEGHIGVDVDSNLIRKNTFIPANGHDSMKTEKLISYDEKALLVDKAYLDWDHKVSARLEGWYYGVLDMARRGEPLSSSQKKSNRMNSRVLAFVEHPFAWMKSKANLVSIRPRTPPRKRLRFQFACMGRNVSRARFLLERSSPM